MPDLKVRRYDSRSLSVSCGRVKNEEQALIFLMNGGATGGNRFWKDDVQSYHLSKAYILSETSDKLNNAIQELYPLSQEMAAHDLNKAKNEMFVIKGRIDALISESDSFINKNTLS